MGTSFRTHLNVVTNQSAVSMTTAVAARVSIAGKSVASKRNATASPSKRGQLVIQNASQKEMRDRIASVCSTKKITDAMKLVAAAKVRKAQDAVINARPFSEQLVKVLFAINSKLAGEDVDVPLTKQRPVKSVMLIVCTGDRGLCGGFNNFIIRKTEQRVAELKAQGVEAKL